MPTVSLNTHERLDPCPIVEAVRNSLMSSGLRSNIPDEWPKLSRMIIEKYEDHTDVGFAVVLLTQAT
ncbi:MAG: hypothetical protein OXI81_12125 [Paracoccaceae bacterium]|nr:hypothetical protein [Paracoccaceae bacterium]MDE2912614.1 hypothetical protein [Paracoccaceae bacterium]